MTHKVDDSLRVNSFTGRCGLEGKPLVWREGSEQKRFLVRNVGLDDLKAILVLPQPALVASFSASSFEVNPGFILHSQSAVDVVNTFSTKNVANVFGTSHASLFVVVREFMWNPYRGDPTQGEVLCQNAVHSGFRDIKPLR